MRKERMKELDNEIDKLRDDMIHWKLLAVQSRGRVREVYLLEAKRVDRQLTRLLDREGYIYGR